MLTITKSCLGCGRSFSFEIEEGKYRMKTRKYCDECIRQRKNVLDSGIGAKTTDIPTKKRRRKKVISIAEMGRFAKANGMSYGQAVAMLDIGKIEYTPVSLKEFRKLQKEKLINHNIYPSADKLAVNG